MKLEVLLSVMNLDKQDLKKMNITTDCIVINQCGYNSYEEYENFKIYSYNEKGISKSRNKALENANGDILLLCDDDVTYNNEYETIIKNEFKKNKDADIIIFNLESINRKIRYNKRNKKVHFYNCLRYGTYRIAMRKQAVTDIKFNELFGPNSKYCSGEDGLFLIDCLKKGLKLYASNKYIGKVDQGKSTWFNGYNCRYFFDRGALYCAINKYLYLFIGIYCLLRNKTTYKKIGFFKALKCIIDGKKAYLRGKTYNEQGVENGKDCNHNDC